MWHFKMPVGDPAGASVESKTARGIQRNATHLTIFWFVGPCPFDPCIAHEIE